MTVSTKRRAFVCALGDSGGPLIIPHRPENGLSQGSPQHDILVGITSFGSPECDGELPAVYTRVADYWKWIEETIKSESEVNTLANGNRLAAQRETAIRTFSHPFHLSQRQNSIAVYCRVDASVSRTGESTGTCSLSQNPEGVCTTGTVSCRMMH